MTLRRKSPCRFEGCENMTGGLTGYCPEHVNVAYPCSEPGCTSRCAAYTKRGYCAEHRKLGDRLYRKGFRE